MSISVQIAKHFRDVFFGGNWTCSNFKDNLKDVTWQQATTQVHGLNTIATLTYHIGYFVTVALAVLQGGPLNGNDKLSFDHPSITCQEDFDAMVARVLADATLFADAVEQLPESRHAEVFVKEQYGTYYRNIAGIIEHTHYHLGQIAIIKKIVQQGDN